MKLAQTPTAQQQPSPQAAAAECRGPKLIDPSDFKFIAGGLPRGGWLDADYSADSLVTPQLPRNGW